MATKINFTKEHQVELFNSALKALFNKTEFSTPMGVINVYDLLHTTTINTLTNMKMNLDKLIATKEAADEWSLTESQQKQIDELKAKSRLVNLVIGYKRYQEYQASIEKERAKLNAELESLKDSQKTPEDRIKEIEDKIKSLYE